MEALTDNPVEEFKDDKYGFRAFAQILAQMILDTRRLPFCVGVYGPWGTGKSSLMKLIEKELEGKHHVKTIWFNPWKYHRREELWSALIRAVLTKIVEEGNPGAKSLAKRLLKTAAWTAIKRAAGPLTLGVISADEIESAKKAFAENEQEYQQHINTFEENFTELVAKYTGDGKLVVFVDDLDRCLPESAITVLESLKLFIGHAQCVFVLGMDKSIVEFGIQKQYGEHIQLSGRDYLDKIVQVPFYIPPVPFNRLKASLQVVKTAQYPAPVWSVLEHGMAGNPRKTKRFVNSFYLLQQILSTAGVDPFENDAESDGAEGLPRDVQDIYLAKLLVMQLAFPMFYEYLVDHPEGWSLLEARVLGGTPEQKKAIFSEYPELKDFATNPAFMRFMGATASAASNDLPQAPKDDVVSLLMRAINLVSESPIGERTRSPRTKRRPVKKKSAKKKMLR